MTRRPELSRWLLVLGAFAAFVAAVAGYARATLVDSDRFGQHAAEAVRAEPVREAIATAFADQLIAQEPQLISARPILISGAEAALGGRAAAGVIARAAADVHRGLLTADQRSLVVNLADLTVVVQAYLRSTGASEQAARLDGTPSQVVTTISDRTVGTQVAHIAGKIAWIAFVAPIVALLALGGGIAAAGDRRRGLRDAGLALLAVGALVLTLQVVLQATLQRHLLPAASPEIADAIFGAFLGDLGRWALCLGGAGALLAAAAASLLQPIDLTDLPRHAWAAATRAPMHTRGRVLRAAALLAAGLLILGSPQGALTLGASLVGGWIALLGLTGLLGLLVGPPPDAGTAPPLRRVSVAAATAAAFLVPTTVAILIAASADSGQAKPATADRGCNGTTALCSRRLDQLVFPTVHNANSNAADGYLNANNGPNIPTQLNMGIRGLLIDALAGQRNADGVVRTDLRGATEDQVVGQIGKGGLAAAQRLAGSVAFGPIAGDTRLYLCHVLCELGASDAVTQFEQIADWVRTHPRQVLMIFIQDEAPAAMITKALKDSGLADFAATLPASGPQPTLAQLIASGRRVVLLAENRAGAPWYPAGFDLVQDTPFKFDSAAELRTDASCRDNRGKADAPMMLVNHWIETYPPNPRNADVVNQKALLVERARRCMRLRDRAPTLLAIDFPERGDVVGAADELNREPLPPVSGSAATTP
ncbi:MAG: hypothetical protein J7513_07155 [Solirubrobacteraceae bacterium]|nr:hypothetical protein [Solirubrobacteraceae bacterium]